MEGSRIASLPFGTVDAVSNSRIESLCSTLSAVVPGQFKIDALGPEQLFRHKTYALKMGSMSIAATATTPILVRRDEVPYATMRIPVAGYCTYKLDKERCVELPGRTAVLLSGSSREAETSSGYVGVHVVFSPERLKETAQAIAGNDAKINHDAFDLGHDREVSLQPSSIPFDLVFRNHFALIDTLLLKPAALAMQSVDDLIYRSIAMLLSPDLLATGGTVRRSTVSSEKRVLDDLCSYIQANLADPISLTRLEQISGLSRRSLQYAFLRHFNCTPMQWLRDQRLQLAHAMLTRSTCDTSVTQVALAAGFSCSGRFSYYYSLRYGESPSATLVRSQRQN